MSSIIDALADGFIDGGVDLLMVVLIYCTVFQDLNQKQYLKG